VHRCPATCADADLVVVAITRIEKATCDEEGGRKDVVALESRDIQARRRSIGFTHKVILASLFVLHLHF
jgi:hypothetical protein